MPDSPSSSPERSEYYDGGDDSPQTPRARAPLSASSSFFIIHESSGGGSIILPSGGTRNAPKLRRKGVKGKTSSSARAHHSSGASRNKKSRSKTPSSAPVTSNRDTPALQDSSSAAPSVVYEGHEEGDEDNLAQAQSANAPPTAKKSRAMELSILNRCGSEPDLPIHSPLSANVYSSSKKRTLRNSTNGASPHLATLQRSRLTPLPPNIRTVMKADPTLDNDEGIDTRQSALAIGDELDTGPLRSKDPLLQEKMRQDAHTISSLKQRLVLLEREVSASTKNRYMTEKQITQLNLETQRLQGKKTQQQDRIDELDKTVLRQRHEYDKLAARYAAVYTNLQRLLDQQQNSSDNTAQHSALQALARENQDFLRKLRVLEARHAEDKTLTSNQDKKIKRLKAEIEALRHMHEAKIRDDDFDEAASDTDHVSRLAKPKKRTESDNNHGGRPNSASSNVSISSSTPMRTSSSAKVQTVQTSLGTHLVTAEAYQYIDPNILKVLEKVDSQFSIANAINLSVVLKKWLNSCVHIVCSTHLPTVLQTLLKRVCELLHCEHAALFTVNHAARKLIAVCSERGPNHWELPLDKGISGYAARHNMLCNVHCASDDPRFYSSTDSITGTTSREVLVLPIVHELQLYLEAHLAGNGDKKVNNLGVFAVLRAWNTVHQKPFSANDQILGSLLAIQAGIILRQTAVTKTLQKINHKTHQILHLPSKIITKASSSLHAAKPPMAEAPGSPSAKIKISPASSEYVVPALTPSMAQLVAVAQKELGECLGIKQLRIFILDAAAHKLWYAGEQLPHDSADGCTPAIVRRYVSAQASLCALLLRSDPTAIVLPEPSAEAAFNDTVDIAGGARGLYLVPILSPWGNGALPFGMVQVSRVAKARLSSSPFALTTSESVCNGIVAGSVPDIVVNNEREAAQQTEDRLMLELLGIFCRVIAGLLHHVAAQQLYDTCPSEILQAQLATLSDHLEGLEQRRKKEDESEDGDDAPIADTNRARDTEHSLPVETNSCQPGRHASIAIARANTPPSHNVRRVVSRAVCGKDMSASDVLQSADVSHEVFNEPGAAGDAGTSIAAVSIMPDTSDTVPEANIGPSDDEDRNADTNRVDTYPELLAPGVEQEKAKETPSWPETYGVMEPYITVETPDVVPDDWTTAVSADTGYAGVGDEEQFASEAGEGYTWGDNGAYDPTLWSAENVGTYGEGVTWEYSVADDAAWTNEDEDSASKTRGDSRQSTDSAYAIDLHLSARNASSAETGEPSGAL